MSLAKTLDQLDEHYYEGEDENREQVIEALSDLHMQYLMEGLTEFRAFSDAASQIAGGVYIPYLTWTELSTYIDDNAARNRIFELVQAFVDSDFEDPEKKKMKALLITYYAMEREFELAKIDSLIVAKAHPMVQEFFRKVTNFVKKNKTSVEMYIEKFTLLREYTPSFELMRMPMSKLKEHLEEEE